MNNNINSKEIQIATTCILISIANADDIFDDEELNIINDILRDFFSLNDHQIDTLIKEEVIPVISLPSPTNWSA